MEIFHPDTAKVSAMPTHPFTNDMGLEAIYDELTQFIDHVPMSQEACAVVVGTGGLFSMVDVLPQTVYITDRQPELLTWVASCVEVVRDCERLAEFKKLPRARYLISDSDVFGERHFMSSESRYASARQALIDRALHYALIDYGQPGEVEQLGEVIEETGEQVRLFNATNMHRHIATEHQNTGTCLSLEEYFASLKKLPWAPEFRILSSAIDLLRPKSLPMQSSIAGYEEVARAGHSRDSKRKRNTFLFRSRV